MTRRPGPRIAAVDIARGLALAGMVVFHLAWDLHAFGFSGLDPGGSPAWRILGHTVAAGFLFLSGLGLVLARERGGCTRSALRRVGVIAVAAMAVTLATWLVAPEAVILFGILHCIAVGNLLALPFLHGPVLVAAAVAAAALAAPAVVPHAAPPPLWWTGLSAALPDTLDVRPLLPWWGFVLLGVVFGRLGGTAALERLPRTSGRLAGALGWAGRRSLAIYLMHQPALLAVLYLLGGRPEGPATGSIEVSAAFVTRCTTECRAKGVAAELCDTLCRCVDGRRGAASPNEAALHKLAARCVSGRDSTDPVVKP